MRVRSACHKSLCVAAYLLRCGARERWRLWGRSAAPKSAVIMRENAPARLLPGSADEPVEYPLIFCVPSFMNLGTLTGSYAGGCDGPVVMDPVVMDPCA